MKGKDKMGASASQTGPSQAEPEVSALRASVPSAAAEAAAAICEAEGMAAFKRADEAEILSAEYHVWGARGASAFQCAQRIREAAVPTIEYSQAHMAMAVSVGLGAAAHIIRSKYGARYATCIEKYAEEFDRKTALASAMSARSAETEGLSPQDASAVGNAETPND